jgi:large subunit ribosomal protein L6e
MLKMASYLGLGDLLVMSHFSRGVLSEDLTQYLFPILNTGPFRINRCPMRRIPQCYVIATSTRIDLGDYKVPKHINDDYFRRVKLNKAKKDDDIFDKKKERYVVSDKKKEDQKEVDRAIILAMRKHPDAKLMWKYLYATFGLRHGMIPHKMKF